MVINDDLIVTIIVRYPLVMTNIAGGEEQKTHISYQSNHRKTIGKPWKTIGKWWFDGILWDLPSGNQTWLAGKPHVNGALQLGKSPINAGSSIAMFDDQRVASENGHRNSEFSY